MRKKHIDPRKRIEEQVRREELEHILNYGSEEDLLKALKAWKVTPTQEIIDEFRKRQREKRGLS